MSTSTAGHRTFPALAIVCILLVACLWLGQVTQPWMARLVPGVSGMAKVDPSLLVLGMVFRLPVSVDLILVPCLFLLLYTAVIVLYPGAGLSRWRQIPYRLGAIGASVIIISCCVAFGCLLS